MQCSLPLLLFNHRIMILWLTINHLLAFLSKKRSRAGVQNANLSRPPAARAAAEGQPTTGFAESHHGPVTRAGLLVGRRGGGSRDTSSATGTCPRAGLGLVEPSRHGAIILCLFISAASAGVSSPYEPRGFRTDCVYRPSHPHQPNPSVSSVAVSGGMHVSMCAAAPALAPNIATWVPAGAGWMDGRAVGSNRRGLPAFLRGSRPGQLVYPLSVYVRFFRCVSPYRHRHRSFHSVLLLIGRHFFFFAVIAYLSTTAGSKRDTICSRRRVKHLVFLKKNKKK